MIFLIAESVANLFFNSVLLAFTGLDLIGLPLDLISVLSSILSYGVWIVGVDLMAIFVSTIVGWWSIKFAVGLVVWIWDLVPFV